jgi:hypothetical protein
VKETGKRKASVSRYQTLKPYNRGERGTDNASQRLMKEFGGKVESAGKKKRRYRN